MTAVPTTDRLVLRTVFLPFDLWQELKTAAFRGDQSTNDLMVDLIGTAVQGLKDGSIKSRRIRFVDRRSAGGSRARAQAKPSE